MKYTVNCCIIFSVTASPCIQSTVSEMQRTCRSKNIKRKKSGYNVNRFAAENWGERGTSTRMLCCLETQDCLFAPQSQWPELLRVWKHDVYHRWQDITVTTVFTTKGTAGQKNPLVELPRVVPAVLPSQRKGLCAGPEHSDTRAAQPAAVWHSTWGSSGHAVPSGHPRWQAWCAGHCSPHSTIANATPWPLRAWSRGCHSQHGTRSGAALPCQDHCAVPPACQGWLQWLYSTIGNRVLFHHIPTNVLRIGLQTCANPISHSHVKRPKVESYIVRAAAAFHFLFLPVWQKKHYFCISVWCCSVSFSPDLSKNTSILWGKTDPH